MKYEKNSRDLFYYREATLMLQNKMKKFGDIKEWKTHHFKRLHEEILSKTEMNISTHTLKRMVGAIHTPDDYLPQQATLEALALFLGFPSWAELEKFVDDPNKEHVIPASIDSFADELIFTESPRSHKSKMYLIGGTVILAALLLFFFYSKVNTPKTGKLIINHNEGNAPLSPVFNWHCDNCSKKDSLSLHLKGENTIPLSSSQKYFSHIYTVPYSHRVELLVNGQVVDQDLVTVNSNGWIANIKSRNILEKKINLTLPVVLEKKITSDDPILSFKSNEREKQIMDSISTVFHQTEYSNFKNFNINAENFELELIYTNPPYEYQEVYCNFERFFLWAEKGDISLFIGSKGCNAYSAFEIGKTSFNINNRDLTPLTREFNDAPQHLLLTCKNDSCSITLNQKKVLNEKCNTKIGIIKGIRFMFSTYGEVTYARLQDLSSGTAEVFGKK